LRGERRQAEDRRLSVHHAAPAARRRCEIDGREFVLADIPGLIEGRTRASGLGDRSSAMSSAAGCCCISVGRHRRARRRCLQDRARRARSLRRGLAEKAEIVALNKADALTPEQLKQQVSRLKRAAKKAPLVISAATGTGVPEVLRALVEVIGAARTAAPDRPKQAAAWQP
jgi:GTP-binding protein